jgi:N-formylglutamate deformylase
MTTPIWQLEVGGGRLVATAIHDGHGLRPEVAAIMALDDAQRTREEDPFTARWTAIAPTRVIGTRSRFEVDLNRPRGKAVYRTPDDAWGLTVWKTPLPEGIVQRSLAEYDAFYAAMRDLFSGLSRMHGRFVVYDLHSYNHRRGGPHASPADPRDNPQVNVGTGTMDRSQWGPVVDRFMADLGRFDYPGGPLDVRENVRFQGGHFARWIHDTFPGTGCCLAIEVKKFFMDEWTGREDPSPRVAIGEALRSTIPGVLEELARLGPIDAEETRDHHGTLRRGRMPPRQG